MQAPSALAIEREAANLRTLRRLSSSQGPGSLPLDPDLPIPPIPSSRAWDVTHPVTSSSSNDEVPADTDEEGDPTHLFWVPAHLHPELAPAEFRAFLKEHANAPPPAESNSAVPLVRALSGQSIGRKKSMLSRQYRPSANDGVENEGDNVISTRRTRGGVFSHAGSQLTVGDLQKLESLAEEAALSDDPNRLRSVLRRSLSLNQASVIDKMDDIGGENVDEPIIVPPPGQILRRSARTKIRKASLQGDGGGHRFAATRRGKQTAAAPDLFLALEHPTSPESDPSEASSSQLSALPAVEHDEHEGLGWDRPLSFSEESAIYDSYADRRDSLSSAVTDDDDIASAYSRFQYETIPPIVIEPQIRPEEPEPLPSLPIRAPVPSPPPSPPAPDPTYVVPQMPLQHPSPKPPSHNLAPIVTHHTTRSPSPGSVKESHTELASYIPVNTSPPPGRIRKEKEKKGGLFGKSKWGGEKSDGKGKKDKPKAGGKGATDRASEKDREREKEKETGFFGSLFGSKKKHDDSSPMTPGAGPATAAALLGASRSKTNLASPSESPSLHGSYARYPIHVERAVYRLSHIKLANPRRPLYEQVLISNLMFWYLGIINKPQNTPTSPSPPPAAVQAAKEEKDRQEKERSERERLEKEQEKETSRREPRKALTKPPANGGPGVLGGPGRKAEMPVKGPQYGIGMVMEQEAEYSGKGPPRRTAAPPGYESYPLESHSSSHSSPPSRPIPIPAPNSIEHQQRQPQQTYYEDSNSSYNAYESEPSRSSTRSPPPSGPRSPPRSPPSSLPPGAMPPVSTDHSWLQQPLRNPGPRSPQDHQYQYQSPLQSPQPSQPSPNRQRSPSYSESQSTPTAESGVKLQGRSLSASAVPPRAPARPRSPPPTKSGRSRSRPRDGGSSSPIPPLPVPGSIRTVHPDSDQQWGKDEDLPLAFYQQQQQQNQQQYNPSDRDRSYSRR